MPLELYLGSGCREGPEGCKEEEELMCVWHEEKRILSLPETNDGRVKVVVLYALILQNSTPLGHRSELGGWDK